MLGGTVDNRSCMDIYCSPLPLMQNLESTGMFWRAKAQIMSSKLCLDKAYTIGSLCSMLLAGHGRA